MPNHPAEADQAPAASLHASPVSTRDRIAAVDVIRGCAVLGILLMNIVPFGLPGAAYDNPTVIGGQTGADLWVWAINAVLFEGKMRALFSMLFGAGVFLLTSRAEARGVAAGASAADIHARRNLWLIAFGLVDAWVLLWAGDVLYSYGLFGIALYPFRKLRPRWLIAIAVVLLATAVPRVILEERSHRHDRELAAQAQAARDRGEALTDEQTEGSAAWERYLGYTQPDEKAIAKTIEANRSGYVSWRSELAGEIVYFQAKGLYRWGIPDIAAVMLLGMGLAKTGFFSARWSARAYVLTLLAAYGVGIPLGVWRAKALYDSGFDPTNIAGPGAVYDSARILMAMGHASVVMLACRADFFPMLLRRMQAVGQMALTNYVGQTLLCTMFFNAYGLGYFARLSRHELYYVVVTVWTLQLLWSAWWLARFRFGPMEWLWRSLTYWQRQPMRR